MITLKEWMELVNYRITEGDTWLGHSGNAHHLSSWNGIHGAGGWSANIVFDTRDQTVYQVEVCDYTNDRAYRIINPLHKEDYNAEDPAFRDQAWDDVNYIDLEVDDDWIQKASAIVAGEDYDTRVSVPLEFSNEELLKYMTMAHERDLTFNQFIEEALREAIKDFEKDPEYFKEKNKSYLEKLRKEKSIDDRFWDQSLENMKDQK